MADVVNHLGIMSWVSAIRTTMANDPGRQILEDQIQNNGILFLEDYLDNIMAGPKHDPIIELVKTPARKKDMPKRTRAAIAASEKAKGRIAMSLDVDHTVFDKENQFSAKPMAPINSFHRTLLQSKNSNINPGESQFDFKLSDSSASHSKENNQKATKNTVRLHVDKRQDEEKPEIEKDEGKETAQLSAPLTKTLTHHGSYSTHETDMSHSNRMLAADSVDSVKELSVIVEDDEVNERSFHAPGLKPPKDHRDAEKKHADPPLLDPTHLPTSDVMAEMDVDDYRPMTFATLGLVQDANNVLPGSPKAIASNDHIFGGSSQHVQTAELLHKKQNDTKSALLNHNEIMSLTENDQLPISKPSIPLFPTIGAPSPLRKSIRIPREAPFAMHASTVMRPSATRSSWLVKAREAKAVEDNVKKSGEYVPMPIAGSKRKSTAMLNEDSGTTSEVEPQQKISRISEQSATLAGSNEEENGLVTNTYKGNGPHAMTDNDLAAEGPAGSIDKLMKTVEGFSSRAGKSMGKSLGGVAASALAEARAAAEAKIAERNAHIEQLAITSHEPDILMDSYNLDSKSQASALGVPNLSNGQPGSSVQQDERRLSMSELVTKFTGIKQEGGRERVFQRPPQSQLATKRDINNIADGSISTTPSNTPPRSRTPVFTLPPDEKMQKSSVFFPPPVSKPMEPRVFSALHLPQALSAQSTFVSTQSSTVSDNIFDRERLSYIQSTQDTELTEPDELQRDRFKISRTQDDDFGPDVDLDEDDSWHEEQIPGAWMPVADMDGRDDSLTWSTDPTRSTKGESVANPSGLTEGFKQSELPKKEPKETASSSLVNLPNDIHSVENDITNDEDAEAKSIRLIPSASQSAISHASSNTAHASSSSQSTNGSSQLGFFSTATKLVSSVLGASKKGKAEPVKSIQLAAVAAKKQQEEAERKAARLKEMEARRQQALQKKLEVDKAREEKRLKEENERRKREREKEDNTEKRVLKAGKKVVDSEKKADIKAKPPSKEKDVLSAKVGKPTLNSSLIIHGAQGGPPKNIKATSSDILAKPSVDIKPTLAPSTAIPPKFKGKGKATDDNISDKQPARVMQAQMQARVQAQIEAQQQELMPPPLVPSEAIELPDINSEYSDSEDEDRVRTFDPPNWAQSPELRQALQSQSTVNPDDIFGAIKPLKMEELFKTRTSRFRVRTSSANWAGTDELTAAEEKEYARRMGYMK